MTKKSADKRSVSTDALETLGMIHKREEKRDAIHLAVEPVVAGQVLKPGNRIYVVDGVARRAPIDQEGTGIVDPFLKEPVLKGERFWLVVLPRKITSLRHVWSHPDFPEEAPVQSQESQEPDRSAVVNEAKTWIENHAAELDLSYDELMTAAEKWVVASVLYIQYGGEHMRNTFDPDNFWPRYSMVTGRVITSEETHLNFFSCSC